MKLAIIGGREFNDYSLLKSIMDKRMADTSKEPISLIISGHAPGADILAERYADENGIEKLIFPADWNGPYKRRAGFIRNQLIIDNADACLCFWDGESKGTKHSIDLANKKGIPVKIVNF